MNGNTCNILNSGFVLYKKSFQHLYCRCSVHVPFRLSAVLLKFRTDKGRDPDPQSYPEDSQLLRQIRDDVLEALEVSADLLNDEFIRYTARSRPSCVFSLRR